MSRILARGRASTAVIGPKPTAVDLFAGAGGATLGLSAAGYSILGAIEWDAIAASTYRLNHPDVHLVQKDIERVSATQFARDLGVSGDGIDLLKACPPCQGFSTLAKNSDPSTDPRNELIKHTIRFVRALKPKVVLVENVPGLARDPRSDGLIQALNRLGYSAKKYIVDAAEFGVPQTRRRLIILAVKGRRVQLPESLLPEKVEKTTVRQAFAAIEASLDDPLSQPRRLSGKVAQRVAAIPFEGNRFDLPEELRLACHVRLGVKRNATGSYGRMKWDRPSPTMTTRCTTPACGPFLHPEEDRPITLREAAALQMFPVQYRFVGSRGQVERQIGNAVPVGMAAVIGRQALRIIRHD